MPITQADVEEGLRVPVMISNPNPENVPESDLLLKLLALWPGIEGPPRCSIAELARAHGVASSKVTASRDRALNNIFGKGMARTLASQRRIAETATLDLQWAVLAALTLTGGAKERWLTKEIVEKCCKRNDIDELEVEYYQGVHGSDKSRELPM